MCEHGYTTGWDCPYCLCPYPGCGKTEAECPPDAHEDPAPDSSDWGNPPQATRPEPAWRCGVCGWTTDSVDLPVMHAVTTGHDPGQLMPGAQALKSWGRVL